MSTTGLALANPTQESPCPSCAYLLTSLWLARGWKSDKAFLIALEPHNLDHLYLSPSLDLDTLPHPALIALILIIINIIASCLIGKCENHGLHLQVQRIDNSRALIFALTFDTIVGCGYHFCSAHNTQ